MAWVEYEIDDYLKETEDDKWRSARALERDDEQLESLQLKYGDTGRTALYRHFDKAGDLLYVGISLSAVNRLAAHMSTSKWASEIATVKIEYFDNRGLALFAERKAIISEKPKFNIIHSEAVAANIAAVEETYKNAQESISQAA